MLVLTDSQAAVMSQLLTKILIREAYRPSEVEECLSWLQAPGDQAVSCPLERWSMSQLANEILSAIRRDASNNP
jgi:hypothetical protein